MPPSEGNTQTVHVLEVIEAGRAMVAEQDHNPEYVRGVVEMTTRLLELDGDHLFLVAAALGAKDLSRFLD